MMLSFLLWPVAYFATGYFTFRVWTWRCPPQNDTFGNDYGDYFKTYNGWFTPSWANTNPKNGTPRGQSVQVTFWQSAFLWPVVWLLVFIIKTIEASNRMGRSICKSACESVTKQLPSPPTIEEEFMIEGNREVEKLLTEEK